MDQTSPSVHKFLVSNLQDRNRSDKLLQELRGLPGVERVDVNVEKSLVRVIANSQISFEEIRQHIQTLGMQGKPIDTDKPQAQGSKNTQHIKVGIHGMHCHSCELLIERQFKQLPGIHSVRVNANRGFASIECEAGAIPSRRTLNEVIEQHGYRVAAGTQQAPDLKSIQQRPRFGQLAGAFAVVLVLGFILSKAGLLKFGGDVGKTTGFAAVFFLGLVAASSSCIAVSGGLMLSVVAGFRERYNLQGRARLIPTASFVVGRIIGYGVLGGVIAGVGKALSPSPSVTGLIMIVAALYMFIMGLDMLHLAPGWLKSLLPRMPKSLGHKVMDSSAKVHWFSPFLLGALTFFLPCGFTQALQIYVLTTGNVLIGALTMFAFALGTAPALLALGWVSNSLKGKAGQFFFRFAGAAVIVLGLYNFNNGLTITGHPISFSWGSKTSAVATDNSAADSNVDFDGTSQIVKTSFTSSGYNPNTFTVKAGVPVHWVIDPAGYGGGCRSFLQIPKLNIGKSMQGGATVIDFTPTEPGSYTFSCGMGMYRGSFNVISS
jgi:sulfite exporter TauE/SafE/copper chaperone CopZ